MASSAGADAVLASWREEGRWWDGESMRAVTRVLTPAGRVEERVREIARQADGGSGTVAPFIEDHREDLDFRYGKVRDEKVKLALGLAPERAYPAVLSSESPPYALLHAVSGYAFGRGTMLAEEIPAVAAAQGCTAALIADPFSLAGAVQFVRSAREVGIKPLVGTTIVLPEGGEIVLVARSKRGYRSLCRLITECHQGEPRLFPLSSWERLARHTADLLCLTGGDGGPLTRHALKGDEGPRVLERLVGLYGRNHVFVQIERTHLPWAAAVNGRLLELAADARVTAVAGGLVTHAQRSHFPAQDVIACIASLCGIEEIEGRKATRHKDQPQARDNPSRALNAERFVRSATEMRRLYEDRPWLLGNTHVASQALP